MKSASLARDIIGVTVIGLIAVSVIGLLAPAFFNQRRHPHGPTQIRVEMINIVMALEDFRHKLGNGQYPPASNDDPEAVKQFLAKAFPKYHGGLPEKYKNLDAATSLVFWLGGMTDKDGKPIGFSADPKNPFDTTQEARIGTSYDFDPKRLRNDGGLLVYLPPGNTSQSDPTSIFVPIPKASTTARGRTVVPAAIQFTAAG
jgi:hypothetical protein